MTEIIHWDGKLQDYVACREKAMASERAHIIEQIKRNICFDALADHEAMATFRMAHPEVVGRCSNHGGKCTDLLLLVQKLEGGTE